MKLFKLEESYKFNQNYNYAIFSDLHIGSNEFDGNSLQRDLQQCKDDGSKVFINGDTLDLIVMQDFKRAAADRIKPEDGQMNKYIKEAEEVLMPYVSLLCVISLGNHETAIIKHHGVDPLAWLIEKLNREKKNGEIQQGHYQNFIRVGFQDKKIHTERCHYDIFMSHGSGQSAPVTKGMIDFNRIVVANQADLYLLGHKHNHIETTYPLTAITPDGKLITKNRMAIETPSYTIPVSLNKNHNWTDTFYGRQALPGYAKLVLKPYKDGKTSQDYRLKSDIHIVSNGLNRSMVHAQAIDFQKVR